MLKPTQPEPGLNWPHLALLLALPGQLLLSRHWGWDAPLTLAASGLLALAFLLVCERIRPNRPQWQASRSDMQRDAASLGLGALLDAAFSLLLNTALLAAFEQGAAIRAPSGSMDSMALQQFWQQLPWPLALVLVILVGELLPYALHRLAHRWPALWRWHSLHHWPEALNASNGVLVHPFNLLWNKLGRALPWLLLAVPGELILWAAMFVQVQELAAHANVAGSLRGLRLLLGGADLHRWHHSTQQAQAQNFGTVTPIWDWLFGTLYLGPAEGPDRVGWWDAAPRPARLAWRALLFGARVD